MLTPALIHELEGSGGLQALLVTLIEEGLIYATWQRHELDWSVAEVAGLLAELMRGARRVADAMDAGAPTYQTLENTRARIVVRDVGEACAVGFCFDPAVPLGLARFHVDRLAPLLMAWLEPLNTRARPPGRAEAILALLDQLADDPDAARLRIALQSGLAIELLDSPETLTPAEMDLLERSAIQVLGVEALDLP